MQLCQTGKRVSVMFRRRHFVDMDPGTQTFNMACTKQQNRTDDKWNGDFAGPIQGASRSAALLPKKLRLDAKNYV